MVYINPKNIEIRINPLTEDGKGKLYVSRNKNPHLSFYEKFLEGGKEEY